MRVKIVNDGSTAYTKVLDAETGEDLTAVLMVQKVTWVHEAGQPPRTILECVAVGLEGMANAQATIRRLDAAGSDQ